MRSRELAALLLRKAAQDEFVLDKLVPDPSSPDEIVGFHAQQAVEKMLKAVLALRAIRYGKVHEIGQILALLRKNSIAYPPEFDELDQLSPFAVEFRYEDAPAKSEQPFDRTWALDCVRQVRSWVGSLLSGEPIR
jgi:HEPN domain-containing protein